MCLAIPMKVVDLLDDFCTVELNSVKKHCYIGFLEQKPNIGDFLLVHAGMAIKVIDSHEAEEILKEIALLLDGELANSD